MFHCLIVPLFDNYFTATTMEPFDNEAMKVKYMDKKTIEKIKKDLLARKTQIEEELKNITEDDGAGESEHRTKFPDIGSKPEENAQEIGEYTTNIATEKVLESSLRDINSALKRMEDNTYGVCKYCNEEIGEKRMLARPVASTCVACKSKLQSKN